ncbi:MAG TPA: coenzyme F420-0:L-glutamate ligase [Candidatus Dormibacteraeota bacterium]|nr:coenzyme F420-0:L-glutamate ligase [Candidatus Dormibacteraeota bacterium]
MTIEIIPVHIEQEISQGDDLAALINAQSVPLADGDVVVITQKAVSKAEGQVVDLAGVEPSAEALELAGSDTDPRIVEVILRESQRVVRHRGPLIITETHHGFICASAGVDRSNAPRPDSVVLLPRQPDASARALRERLEELSGASLAVIIADTMGRPLREGIVGTAIGASGVEPLRDLAGLVDPNGYKLSTTIVAVADELASAADLVLGKVDRVPAAVIRGYALSGDGPASLLIRERSRDLFA